MNAYFFTTDIEYLQIKIFFHGSDSNVTIFKIAIAIT